MSVIERDALVCVCYYLLCFVSKLRRHRVAQIRLRFQLAKSDVNRIDIYLLHYIYLRIDDLLDESTE